jgi:outer membrane autotransporter protein
LTGGRLHGLSGSTIRARTITVEQAATFGSAGSVVGDINVAGTLSPGASPGTMTVTGNVALAGGSNTLMEITPTVSDQIVISGKLAIASGASLVLSVDQQSRPGTSLDLIIAAGGIAGSFTNVVKPASLFGFIVQQDDRIRLLGQFLNNSAFSPQVGRAIDYVNGQIQADALDDDLLAALPLLVTASGGSNATAFARLTAQPYAAATQLAVESGLTLAEAGRGIARLSSDEAPRAFALGQYLGGLGRLAGDDAAGLSASRGRSYGLLGGFGIGNDRWSVAAFGGYLDGRQTLPDLGAHTDTDGWFAGLGAGYALGALRVDAMLGYYDASADTSRPTPGTTREAGRYRLKSWIGDLSFSYEASLGSEWAVQPKVGVTYVQTRRTVLVEDGGTVWALDVAGDKHHALFADAGLGFGRSRASQAALRPFVRLGLQYQLRGRGVEALAGFDGTGRTFLSQGAGRAGLMGSVTGGGEVRVSNAVSFFATASQSYSEDDRRASASVGLKFAF